MGVVGVKRDGVAFRLKMRTGSCRWGVNMAPSEVAGLGRRGVIRIPPSEVAQDEVVLGLVR